MCLTKCELFLKGRGTREAEHLASLPVVLTMVLTYPLIPLQTGSWLGVGMGVCVCMCGDEENGEEVVGFLIPLGGQWGGEV